MSGLASATATVVLTLLALGAGAGLGHWWGSRNLLRPAPRVMGWGLIATGAGLRLVVETVSLPGAAGLVVVSHALLLAACVVNRACTGVPIIALGLIMMLAPTVLNGGMPVSRAALAEMGSATAPPELPGGRHVEVDRDRLAVLGDILPVPVGGRPVSFGELVVLAGLADATFRVAGRRAGRRLGRLGVLRSVPAFPAFPVVDEPEPWADHELADLEARDDDGPTVLVLAPSRRPPLDRPPPEPA